MKRIPILVILFAFIAALFGCGYEGDPPGLLVTTDPPCSDTVAG